MTDTAHDQATAQLNSIRDMVAALEVDYDRLEELRELRADLRAEFDGMPESAGVDFDHWARNQHLLTSEDIDELAELEAQAGIRRRGHADPWVRGTTRQPDHT